MKQQRTRKRKDISDNVKKQEEKQKRRRKKVVIESSEETVSDSNDKKSRRAIVLHNSKQEVNSVNNLKDYIESLSKEQRDAVREIGFESILKFNLHSVPRKFGYWLVKIFDADNNEINTGVETIKITAEFIQKILFAYQKQGFDDAENTEVFSLDKIDSTTLQEFEDELEIAAQNEGRCLNENEEIFENESEKNDEDDAEEQPITLLKAATDWIDQKENQENVQNSPIKTNETEKTQTESGGSWGQFFIKPSIGNKDKMWVDSQSRLRNFMQSQNQSEGLPDIHSTKSGDENMKNIEDKRSHEEYLVSVLDDHLKGFEDIFENIQSRIDELVEEYPNSEALHNKVNEWVSLMEKLNHQAKKHKKVNIDSNMMETPSRFLNLSQNEDTENQIISTPLVIKRNDDDDAKCNEDNIVVVQSSSPEKNSNNDPASILQTHMEKPSLEQSSFSEETPSVMLEMIKRTDEEEKKSNQRKFRIMRDTLFEIKEHLFLYRYAVETMRPGLEITGETFPLNDKEETNKDNMIEAFTMNIEKILQGAKLKSIKDFKIILVPILHIQHFFVISFNLEENQIFIIDNSAKEETNEAKYGNVPENTRNALAAYLKSVGHEKADDIKNITPVRMQMKWRTQYNGIDCGIFTMRHMECYHGEPVEKWDCGFNVEYEQPARDKNKKPINKQTAQLEDLRRKFIAKILLHEINEQRDYVIEDSKKFRDLSAKLKKQSYDTSLDRIKDMLSNAGLL
ncbi:uncharacterized protein LOC118481691 [Helianthus annuus]|uniref:uncharacterized protein LOC118481691 n=1 Tax=Helianthus annuus TaxID=4232 RepID=UPI001652E348|nr:uncharacterized protein LOC118481691 [Helianthus annuus]